MTAATAARDEAIDRVERGAADVIEDYVGVVIFVATIREHFTTDAVDFVAHQAGHEPLAEPRAMGAVMRRAAARGICEATSETRRSTRAACHARPVRVWRSLLWGA